MALAFGINFSRIPAATFYQGVTPATVPWPGGVVPYEFDPAVTTQQREVYLDGMREWELAGNVKFIPHTTEPNFVLLRFFFQKGTNTYVPGTPAILTIDSLARSQICHETGHLLGFQHEHVRTNRDGFITINTNNLQSGISGEGPGGGGIANLYLIDSNSTSFGPYDFESVMHYAKRLFAQDPNVDVIDPQPPYVARYFNRIGNLCISPLDRAGAAFLYGPPSNAITNIVTTTADVGQGSLRAAIYYANDHPGTTIRFNIPNTDPGLSNGVYTIYLTGELPPLVTNGTLIDASTQPGFAGKPVVTIDGSKLLPETGGASGIYFYESSCTIRGLAIQNVTFSAVEMLYNFCASNHVEGCFLGLAAGGSNAAPNGFQGVNLAGGAHHNVIGGTNASQRNVLSGNSSSYGVTVTETNTDNNVIEGNYIGLDATGTFAVPNFKSGIGIFGGPHNTVVGGTNTGAGNVISGNTEYGIFLGDPITLGTVIQGNYVGTDATGNTAVPNTFGGIAVFGGVQGVTIGGANAGARNVISGNQTVGVYILGPGTSNNVVAGNFVGLNASGNAALPNTFAGIYLLGGAQNNFIGGTNAGAGNVVSGNFSEGIYIANTNTSNNRVLGNRIGTDASGTIGVPNGFTGVGIWDSAGNNFIGGTNTGAGNLISGNGNGVTLGDPSTSANSVQGNFIGTKAGGLSALANDGNGVYIRNGASGNLVGGTVAAARNIISGNGGAGVFISDSGTASNLIEGNYIGTDPTGLVAISNLTEGVTLFAGAQGNQIGGTANGAGNVIAASQFRGIFISDPGTSGNIIQGNNVGIGANGFVRLGNGLEAIVIQNGAASNSIGGSSPLACNILSGNGAQGVYLSDSNTINNVVQGNYIGVAADGVTAVGNLSEGVIIRNGAQRNIIGSDVNGVTGGNIIANSGLEGVAIYDSGSTSNTIRGNSMFGNGRLGINLVGGTEDAFGVTANDLLDLDAGPNGLQNFPVIGSVNKVGGTTFIAGMLNSTPNHSFLIDMFRNPDPEPSGYGEGQVYLGTVSAVTDNLGNGSFTFNTSDNLTGQSITATATDTAFGNTSEFSGLVPATGGGATAMATFVGPLVRTGSGFGFTLNLQPNLPYRIQATTNLANSNAWVQLTNFTPTSSPVSYIDPGATNLPRRFYRVVSP